ncbi:hypothetical protein BDZ91DRAFT_720393 [Kalaharituber pfeilii]|nr:hypothetical protein BDZ91DRAFT_720393 [Kalaharituber pfeilii]
MIPDELFEECITILQNTSLLDEEQSEKVAALISEKTSLTGTALENATLDVLWRHKEKLTPSSPSPTPVRHTIIRSRSPAPWQIPRVGTPNSMMGSTPPVGPPPGFPPYLGGKSPFPSPRPSPRLAFASPLIPHSPSLSAYEFAPSETPPPPEIYGDSETENVAWLVNEEANRDLGNMSPHDMLRSVLGEGRTDDEIEQALDAAGYDLSAAMAILMGVENGQTSNSSQNEPSITIIGKSTSPQTNWARPSTPKSGVICRFFLSTGQCLRADCRFSHDLGKTICKYWVMGSCLAGDTCIFSHDPTVSLSKISPPVFSTPPPPVHFHDPSAFPSLTGEQWTSTNPVSPPPGFKPLVHSRPGSRQQNREISHPSVPQVDDTEAFPSLGSATKAKKGARRNQNANSGQASPVPTGPSSMADVVRMASPSPHSGNKRWNGSNAGTASSNAGAKSKRAQAAASIPPPTQIPWLETGNPLNKLYLKHRSIAIKHGGLRNKYLQAAAAAWNRNDAKSAKSLSLRGANENEAMRKAHRAAAQAIYEERNKHANASTEIFVDLHGLHPEEATEYLERILLEQQNSTKPLYAIIGSGHHAKGGKDKIGKAVRGFLDEWKYVYREFSISGAAEPHNNGKGGYGGILGIDPRSYDKSLVGPEDESVGLGVTTGGSNAKPKVALNSEGANTSVKKEPPKGPGGKGGRK